MNIKFALTDWTYERYNEFIAAVSAKNFRLAGHMVEEIVLDWSGFDVPEGAEHPIDHLSLEDAFAVIQSIQIKSSEYVENFDAEADVIVDLSKWRWDDFNKFTDHAKQGNIKAIIAMMTEVARFKTGNPKKGEPINAVQGMMLMKALSAKLARVFSGGN